MLIYQRSQHKKSIIAFMLLALLAANSLLAWHNTAHAKVASLTHQTTLAFDHIPAPDNDCPLCLSAHGTSQQATLTTQPVPWSLHDSTNNLAGWKTNTLSLLPHYRQNARSPPFI